MMSNLLSLVYAAKLKTERVRTALVKNKARQIIKEFAPPTMEKMERIIEDEESRRIQEAAISIN